MMYQFRNSIKAFQTALLVVVALCSSAGVLAEESRIAVIDVQGAILMTEKAKQKLEELQKQPDFKNNLESIESLKTEYEGMVEKYTKDRAVMSAEKRAEQERQILDKQQDIKYIASKLQQLEKEYVESVMQEFGGGVQEVLAKIVEEKDIGLLLRKDSRAVMHAGGSYDITGLVVERLNAIR